MRKKLERAFNCEDTGIHRHKSGGMSKISGFNVMKNFLRTLEEIIEKAEEHIEIMLQGM